MSESFLGAWLAKKPGIGFTSNRLVFLADGTFSYVSSDEAGPQVQMHGTWKFASDKNVKIINESLRAIGRVNSSAELLDSQTLELETYGNKEQYIRDPKQPEPPAKTTNPPTAKSPPFKSTPKVSAGTIPGRWYNKDTIHTAELNIDSKHTFEKVDRNAIGKQVSIRGRWQSISDTKIELSHAVYPGTKTMKMIGELRDRQTLVLTIDGLQKIYRLTP